MGERTPESTGSTPDLLLPGEDILVEATFLGLNEWPTKASGTSVATAIAAGLASLILSCGRLAFYAGMVDMDQEEQTEFLEMQRKKQRHNVLKVFDMMKANASDTPYVRPWTVFNQGEWGEAGSTLDWIIDTFVAFGV